MSGVYQVFVSYGSPDHWVARQIGRHIDENGGRAFCAGDDLHYGSAVTATLKEELRSSRELIALLTPTSVLRSWIWTEIGAAWGQDKRVVGVLYGVTRSDLHAENGMSILEDSNLVLINDLDKYFAELKRRMEAFHR